jgi:hypothetical protein
MMFPFGDFQLFTCAFGSDSRSLMFAQRSANSSECSVMDNGRSHPWQGYGLASRHGAQEFTHARSEEVKDEGTKTTPLLILCGL